MTVCSFRLIYILPSWHLSPTAKESVSYPEGQAHMRSQERKKFLYSFFFIFSHNVHIFFQSLKAVSHWPGFMIFSDQSAEARGRQCSDWPSLGHVVTAELGSRLSPTQSLQLRWKENGGTC